jgi:hypothetical protein
LSCAKNPVHKMRYGHVFTACEPETQGLFTALYTEIYPGFSHACRQVFHDAMLPPSKLRDIPLLALKSGGSVALRAQTG